VDTIVEKDESLVDVGKAVI